MKHYLVYYECPCMGRIPELFEAENDDQADEHAWIESCHNAHYTNGGYDLYRLEYDHHAHTDILVPVVGGGEE